MGERRKDEQLRVIVEAYNADTTKRSLLDPSASNLVERLQGVQGILSQWPAFLAFGGEQFRSGVIAGIRYALGEDVPEIEPVIGPLVGRKLLNEVTKISKEMEGNS